MTKLDMREYTAKLDEMVSHSLKLWKKLTHIENGEAVSIVWQFEQALIVIDIFWKDGGEGIHLLVNSPRHSHKFTWTGLTEDTLDRLIDRIGNLAQMLMYRYPNAG